MLGLRGLYMYDGINLKFDFIISNISDKNLCFESIDSIIDMCSNDDFFVFSIYRFNCLFLNYLNDNGYSCISEKYKNDELYCISTDISEKKDLLFSLSLSLLNSFKDNNVVSNSDYFILFSYFVDKLKGILGADDKDSVLDNAVIDESSSIDSDSDLNSDVIESQSDSNLDGDVVDAQSSSSKDGKKILKFLIFYLIVIIFVLVGVIIIFNIDDRISLLKKNYNYS